VVSLCDFIISRSCLICLCANKFLRLVTFKNKTFPKLTALLDGQISFYSSPTHRCIPRIVRSLRNAPLLPLR